MENIEIKAEYIGQRIDVLSFKLLKEMGLEIPSRSYVKDNWGEWIQINGKKVKPSYKIREGDSLEIASAKMTEILSHGRKGNDILAQEGELDIVYEDSDFLVLNKAKGVVVHPGVGHPDNTLINNVRYYLESKNEYDEFVERAGVVHRLDKGVSGLIVFAKNLKAQEHLKTQFQEHNVQKLYIATIVKQNVEKEFEQYLEQENTLVEAIEELKLNRFKPDDSWYRARGYVGRDSINRMRMSFKNYEFTRSKSAMSYIKGVGEDTVLVKIQTGRMHQIRATLKSLGAYVKGDSLYENSKGKATSSAIELESVYLRFEDLSGKYIALDLLDR